MALDVGTKELERKIKERQEWLEKIVPFIETLVRERGEVVSRDQSNWHTNVVAQLDNFEGFSFMTDLGQTDFGGNDVTVWFHDRPKPGLESTRLVLAVYYQGASLCGFDCRVNKFDDDGKWQAELDRLVSNRDKILRERDEQEKQRAAQEIAEREERGRRATLQREAKRLGF